MRYAMLILIMLTGCQTVGRIVRGTPKTVASELLSPVEKVDSENRQYLGNVGRRAFAWGLAVLIGGGIMSAVFAVYLPRKLGDCVFYAGAGVTVYGLIMMESAKRLHVAGAVALVGAIGFILWKLKWKGIGRACKSERVGAGGKIAQPGEIT